MNNIILALESAYANLENNRLLINSLNVFPVPDGDTGDNMSVTFRCGLDKIRSEKYNNDKELLSDFATACVMGARGNSGVILSLAVKGFASAYESESTDTARFVCGLKNATELCYESVASAKEGTVLTVLRACADKAKKVSQTCTDIEKLFMSVYTTAAATLSKTKELLPQLKEADVVDAGAKGLVCIMEGIRLVLQEHRAYEINDCEAEVTARISKKAEIENGYCCQCLIRGTEKIEPQEFDGLGDSLIIAESNSVTNLHIHSSSPDKVLAVALKHGELLNIKIENMRLQNDAAAEKARKKYGFVVASPGAGISECFSQFGCDEVITTHEKVSSGQVLESVSRINAKIIFLLPNDKNNYLAFKQAMKMSDKDCVMLESEDAAIGLGMLMGFDESKSKEENIDDMYKSQSHVKSGKICVADKSFKDIKRGESIAFIDGKIAVKAANTLTCLEKTVEKLSDKDYNVISVFCAKEETVDTADELLKRKYPDCQINIIYGGQRVYDFLVFRY